MKNLGPIYSPSQTSLIFLVICQEVHASGSIIFCLLIPMCPAQLSLQFPTTSQTRPYDPRQCIPWFTVYFGFLKLKTQNSFQFS